MFLFFIFPWLDSRRGPRSPHCRGFEVSRSHSDTSYSAVFLWQSDTVLSRDFYLTTHNTHKRQRVMLPAGFEPAFPASERPQACTIERVVVGIGVEILSHYCVVPPFLSFSFYVFIHTAFPLYLTR